jgi:hypothetical protein
MAHILNLMELKDFFIFCCGALAVCHIIFSLIDIQDDELIQAKRKRKKRITS